MQQIKVEEIHMNKNTGSPKRSKVKTMNLTKYVQKENLLSLTIKKFPSTNWQEASLQIKKK